VRGFVVVLPPADVEPEPDPEPEVDDETENDGRPNLELQTTAGCGGCASTPAPVVAAGALLALLRRVTRKRRA
jgi:uncharacterized protein (TIGR03382 family)